MKGIYPFLNSKMLHIDVLLSLVIIKVFQLKNPPLFTPLKTRPHKPKFGLFPKLPCQ